MSVSRKSNSRKSNSQQLTVSDLNKIRDFLIENGVPPLPGGYYKIISPLSALAGISKRLKTRNKRYYFAVGDIG